MATFAQRKEYLGWSEPPDPFEVSPGRLWVPDDEEESARRRARATKALKPSPLPHVNTQPGWIDTPGEIKGPPSSLWTREELVTTPAHEQILKKPEALLSAAVTDSEDHTSESVFANTDIQEQADALPTSTSSAFVVARQEPPPPETGSAVSAAERLRGLPETKKTSAALPRTPRPLVLDESAVLPNEASFATVPLYRDVVSRPRVLDESAVLPNEASSATIPLHRSGISRPGVLDESTVLPHEASFATVRLYQGSPHSYLAANKFVPRFTVRARRLLPALLIIAVCSAALVFRMKFKTQGDTAPSPSATTATTEPMVLQTGKALPDPQQQSTSNPSEPIPPKESAGAPLATDTAAEETLAVAYETPDTTVPRNRSERKARPDKNPLKDGDGRSVLTRNVQIPKSNGVSSQAQNISRSRTGSAVNSANDTIRAAAKSQPAVTGGGERPRRVSQETQKPDNSPRPAPFRE